MTEQSLKYAIELIKKHIGDVPIRIDIDEDDGTLYLAPILAPSLLSPISWLHVVSEKYLEKYPDTEPIVRFAPIKETL